jgi:hypothetical protein
MNAEPIDPLRVTDAGDTEQAEDIGAPVQVRATVPLNPLFGVTCKSYLAGVQRNKLRVDARKWVAAKLLPRKYGERMLNEHGGRVSVTLESLVCGRDDD